MATTSAEARAHLRQAIDDRIKELEELTRALQVRRNALVPISRLPPETLAVIFSFLSPPACDEELGYLSWLHVTHVCRQWRDIALDYPHLWSHIDFTNLTPDGVTEILARAKMAPLHLEMKATYWGTPNWDVFARQLETQISHTRRLCIAGEFHQAVLEQLLSPAPILEFFSLSDSSRSFGLSHPIIPVTLFDGVAPRLTSLELDSCDISWKSPLLKGLQALQILRPSVEARPSLEDWLDALNGMPQLKTLVLHSATPAVSFGDPLIPQRTITLPSLTRFSISASATDCTLALAHLMLPSLTSLHVDAESSEEYGEDVQLLIPYVAQNCHSQQDSTPLQSILLSGEATHAKMVAWTLPDVDVLAPYPTTLDHVAVSARMDFSATTDRRQWSFGTNTVILDALLTHLPVNSISTLTAQGNTRLSKEVWLSHVPRLVMLKRVRLVPSAVGTFRQILAEDGLPDGRPRLPLLTKLILVKVSLTMRRACRLRDALMKRMEQGAPVEDLDLRTCVAVEHAIQLLAETVGNVQGPIQMLKTGHPAFFNREGEISSSREEEGTDDDEYDRPGDWDDDGDGDEDDEDDYDYYHSGPSTDEL